MERVIERFTLNRVDRTSYRFETERLPTIQFCNPLLTGFFNQVRRIEIQFADQTFLLTGTTTWPHEIILSQSGREIMATSREKVVGSQYYTWKSDAKTLKIHPRKSDWIVGRHWAFHAWADGKRIAYWQQRKALANIEGIRTTKSDPLQIATIAFGFMFDWEQGSNWKF